MTKRYKKQKNLKRNKSIAIDMLNGMDVFALQEKYHLCNGSIYRACSMVCYLANSSFYSYLHDNNLNNQHSLVNLLIMKDFNSNIENKEDWLTPPEIIKSLGSFHLDPCTPRKMPWTTASFRYTKAKDGLFEPWYGRVWCNPPYGKKTFEWLRKLANHGNGIALVFARTETKGFHSEVWGKADAIFFFKGRIKFYRVDGTQGGTANAPSCLVAYGKDNVKALKNCGLNGKLITL
jgi:hypothetical protein